VLEKEHSQSAKLLREEVLTVLYNLNGQITANAADQRKEFLDANYRLQDSVMTKLDSAGTINIGQHHAARDEMTALVSGFRIEVNEASERREALQIEAAGGLKEAVQVSLSRLGTELRETTHQLSQSVRDRLQEMTQAIVAWSANAQLQQDSLRQLIDKKLDGISESNAKKLEEIRQTVDEKLHSTLERRLTESFGIVTSQLLKVQSGLVEMQDIATSVGDLKRVLTNVKTRGGFAEVQLGLLLEQMLAPDQYLANARVRPETQETVEYAVKFPSQDDGSSLLLPVDAKFPREDWERLEDAQIRADAEAVLAAGKALENRLKTEAKRISDKYINPPETTNFAIMFLATESLFAEAVRRPGLIDELQIKYRVSVAGPTTFMAMLTSFQMGFKTMAIQKKGAEVWRLLSAAKTEFQRFDILMAKVERQVNTVQNTLSEVGKKTKTINRKLRSVNSIATASEDVRALLDFEDNVEPQPADESQASAASNSQP
jgi:DNA recombination protein RmuC